MLVPVFSRSLIFASVALLSAEADSAVYRRSVRPYQQPNQQQQGGQSIWQIVSNNSTTSTFAQQVQKFPALVGVLAGNVTEYAGAPVKNVTVFVPINSAFDALPPALRRTLIDEAQGAEQSPKQVGNVGPTRQSGAILQGLLAYHVLNSTFFYSQNMQNTTFPTLASPFNVTLWQSPQGQGQQGGAQQTQQQHANEATVIGTQQASNGVIYYLDRVISPLWSLNISLAGLPNDITIPQVINIAKYLN